MATMIDKIVNWVYSLIVKNRWDYTEKELQKALSLGLFEAIDMKSMRYWLKAEPVCSMHCSSLIAEGQSLYFNPMGMLIRHKCPLALCIHGLAQLSPLIYSYYDRMLQGKDPNGMVFNTVTCTDGGVELGGLGRNTFRLTYEKMPFLEYMRLMLSMAPYLIRKNRRAVGDCRAVREAPTAGGPEPDDFTQTLPLDDEELEAFLAMPPRVLRLRGIERFRDHRIIVRVVESSACIAGHDEGDEFVLDSMGRLLLDENSKDICLMALNKIWYRVLLMLERMADAEDGPADLTGKIFELPMSCFGAGLPLGACGRILMTVEVREPVALIDGR